MSHSLVERDKQLAIVVITCRKRLRHAVERTAA